MATYVPYYKHDIFVSYAHVDNEPLAGADTRWVTNLVTGLQPLLGQKLGRADAYSLWMDYELRGNEPVTPDILSQLHETALLVLILSPGYLASEWCCRRCPRSTALRYAACPLAGDRLPGRSHG